MIKICNGKQLARCVLIVLIIINCIVIFRFSSEQAEKSDKTSGRVVDAIIEKSPTTRNLNAQEKEIKKGEIVTPVRKTGHFTIYTCLGALIYLLSRTFEGKNKNKIIISILLAFLYACSDEIHQLFVNGRSGEFADVLIDTCGAGFGVLIVISMKWIYCKIIEKNRKNK